MRTSHVWTLATLPVLALVLCAPQSHAQTVLLEDFETPDTGNFITFTSGQSIVTSTLTWTVTANSVDLFDDAARAEAAAFDGAQAVDLTGSPGEGVIETSFATVPGTTYAVVFHYARNAFLGTTIGSAQVDVLGTGVLLQAQVDHDPGLHAFDTYLQFSDTFVANSGTTLLRFTGLNPGVAGVTLDGISVTGVPAVPALPSAAHGIAAGLLMLLVAGVTMRTRKRSAR